MKKNSTTKSKGSPSWKRNIRFQKDQPDEFMKEYCYLVVIEGIISDLKKMFGSVISSKRDTTKMWRYYVDLYYGTICIKTGEKMNLRATLVQDINFMKREIYIY